MDFENLKFDIADQIGVLTVNRPESMNALNSQTLHELEAALDGLAVETSLRALVITGAGQKSFVAGADIRELAELDAAQGRARALRGQRIFRKIETSTRPIIAAVNGFCLGGGCELALSCHLRVASENARFGQPEVKLGLIPGYGGSQRLARLVGRGRAFEMLLTGDMIGAEEAYRIGLVNQVASPDQDLLEVAHELCRRILKNGPLAQEMVIRAVNHGLECPLDQALELEASLFGLSCASEDGKEGTQAFLEKRKPDFTGN